MSDPNVATDPVDKAYVEAEALLSDEAARADRRARVLAAIAREPAAPVATPSRPRSPWRRGGWLAAASVAVFCAVLTARLYQPAREPPPPAPAAAPATATVRSATLPSVAAKSRVTRPAPAPRRLARAPAPIVSPPPEVRLAEPAAAKARAEAAPEAVPAAPAPPPPPPPPPAPLPALAAGLPPAPALAAPQSSSVGEVVVTGARIARRGRPSPDPATRLRAAAAAGRIADMDALLAQGVPADAADADGTTALMKSIQADRPAAAALLLRYGASLDETNAAGVSARDMAKAKNDPELDRALGLPAADDSPARARIGSQ